MLKNEAEIERAHRDVTMGDYAGRYFVLYSSDGGDPYEAMHHTNTNKRSGSSIKVSNPATFIHVRAAIMEKLDQRSWRTVVVYDRGRDVSYYVDSDSPIGALLELQHELQKPPRPGVDYGFKLK